MVTPQKRSICITKGRASKAAPESRGYLVYLCSARSATLLFSKCIRLVSVAKQNELRLPFEPRYAMLEGIEGRLSEGMRRHRLRRARYRGQQKMQQSLLYTRGKSLCGTYQFPPHRVSVTIAFASA